jgi:hypothetical protein
MKYFEPLILGFNPNFFRGCIGWGDTKLDSTKLRPKYLNPTTRQYLYKFALCLSL